MKRELYQFICPVFYLCYLINADSEGLTDEEEREIKTKLDGFRFLYADEEEYFSYYNDFNKLGSDVVKIYCEKIDN